VTRTVATEALDEPTKHKLAVALENHVDEVDDDDAADVAQPQLTYDLFGGLQVGARDRVLQPGLLAAADEGAGVDVDHRHGFGAIDDQRTAGRQEHLALERLVYLLIETVGRVGVRVVVAPAGDPIGEIGCDVVDVALDHVPGVRALDDETVEVLVEQVTNDLDHQIGLRVEQIGRLAGFDLALDVFPPRSEGSDITGELVLGRPLRGSADDDADVLGQDLLEERLEPGALVLGKLAGDAAGLTIGHQHQESARQADLAGESGTLLSDRVLGDLDQDRLAGLERVLDLACLAIAECCPVDLSGVENGVASGADVDERGLHAWQHVLHLAEVDVADDRDL